MFWMLLTLDNRYSMPSWFEFNCNRLSLETGRPKRPSHSISKPLQCDRKYIRMTNYQGAFAPATLQTNWWTYPLYKGGKLGVVARNRLQNLGQWLNGRSKLGLWTDWRYKNDVICWQKNMSPLAVLLNACSDVPAFYRLFALLRLP